MAEFGMKQSKYRALPSLSRASGSSYSPPTDRGSKATYGTCVITYNTALAAVAIVAESMNYIILHIVFVYSSVDHGKLFFFLLKPFNNFRLQIMKKGNKSASKTLIMCLEVH